MIFEAPDLTDQDDLVLALINGQRNQLRVFTQSNPRRWMGSLRRSTFAKAIRASNSIEGINASMENVMAAVEQDDPSDIEQDTWNAIKGYRDAMTYLMQAAQDPYFEFSKQFLKSLQFMMIGHDMTKNPGQWRPGSIYVVNGTKGQTVYEGPDAGIVNLLIEELVGYLRSQMREPVIVRGAMAHLNLTMIHPFKDGNGRVSRALQTLVLAREGLLHPVFSSIEEWLGRATQEYYAVLAEVGQGQWNPGRSALPWVRFCFKCHFHQAATLIRRNNEYEALFTGIQEIIKREHLPERMELPMFESALNLVMTNARYRRQTDVSEVVASRDLKRLADADLLVPVGEKRGRIYRRGAELGRLRDSVRTDSPLADPYEIVKREGAILRQAYSLDEPRLPGM
jgi:Fic family protein